MALLPPSDVKRGDLIKADEWNKLARIANAAFESSLEGGFADGNGVIATSGPHKRKWALPIRLTGAATAAALYNGRRGIWKTAISETVNPTLDDLLEFPTADDCFLFNLDEVENATHTLEPLNATTGKIVWGLFMDAFSNPNGLPVYQRVGGGEDFKAQYQYMLHAMVSQNVSGADWARGHPLL
jgi:hypothetical protein